MTLPRAETSRRAPYKAGETWQERHARRVMIALDDRQRLEGKLHGIKHRISVRNEGRYWRIRAGGRSFEWWPQTGRVVAEEKYTEARKAHDVDQLSTMIVRMVK